MIRSLRTAPVDTSMGARRRRTDALLAGEDCIDGRFWFFVLAFDDIQLLGWDCDIMITGKEPRGSQVEERGALYSRIFCRTIVDDDLSGK